MLIIKRRATLKAWVQYRTARQQQIRAFNVIKMKPKDVAAIKGAFITYSTPRFMKQFSLHLPYGYRDEYMKKVKELNLERLAALIKVVLVIDQSVPVLDCPL